jgi:hypothetical protein
MVVMPGFMLGIHVFFQGKPSPLDEVRLERGERGRITPKVTRDWLELGLPLTRPRKAG